MFVRSAWLVATFASVVVTETHVRAIAVTSTYVVWLTADGMVLRAASN